MEKEFIASLQLSGEPKSMADSVESGCHPEYTDSRGNYPLLLTLL